MSASFYSKITKISFERNNASEAQFQLNIVDKIIVVTK